MTIHQKRSRKFPAGMFRAMRIWNQHRERVLLVPLDQIDSIPDDRLGAAHKTIDADGARVIDASFEYGPWVPMDDPDVVQEAFWRACGHVAPDRSGVPRC
jgi:hypothetical protein